MAGSCTAIWPPSETGDVKKKSGTINTIITFALLRLLVRKIVDQQISLDPFNLRSIYIPFLWFPSCSEKWGTSCVCMAEAHRDSEGDLYRASGGYCRAEGNVPHYLTRYATNWIDSPTYTSESHALSHSNIQSANGARVCLSVGFSETLLHYIHNSIYLQKISCVC